MNDVDSSEYVIATGKLAGTDFSHYMQTLENVNRHLTSVKVHRSAPQSYNHPELSDCMNVYLTQYLSTPLHCLGDPTHTWWSVL